MALTPDRKRDIERAARRVRIDTIEMTHAAKCGHPGGPLGMADFMATLFMAHLRLDGETLHDPDRDRLVLGNGHTCAGLYSLLSQKGLFPPELLATFRKLGSPLQGHPHRNPELGIDMSTGSLGNGLSVGVGMALAARLNGWSSRIYVASSDGESQEGQIWEAATSAAHYGLSNLCVLVDFNNIQIDGVMREVMDVRDLRAKYEAFGWHAVDVDGHDIDAVDGALCEARETDDRPSAIICHTTLGKGVSFMENEAGWHGVAPDDEQATRALAELGV
ncbi:MAG: transketolase [Planctomycetota bacterium]|jgi:transketolase|nr:transketolase [Planctomycetota bacterium]MDP6991016.1 transketolase [Planctomycetota bacterium]